MSEIDKLRRWAHVREGYWFKPKPFGLGATPVTWQGWALVIGTIALVLADLRLIEALVPKVAIAVILIAALVVISYRKTDGAWRWHWGFGDAE